MKARQEFHIAGAYDRALTHFAAAGLAEILVDAGVEDVAWGWSGGGVPRARVLCSATPDDVGGAVREHAARHNTDASWVQAEFESPRPNSSSKGVLSPRLAAPDTPGGWRELERERRRALDRIDPDAALDHRFVAALGRPAYWRDEGRQRNPDAGASRWEMKTRNKGQQFVGDRLAPLAHVVADRAPSEVREGLEGRTRRDELGRDGADSRTATGLAVPGPVDSATAWCALWGMAGTATWWNPAGIGTTSGVFPVRKTHPRWAVLPILARPVTPARYRHILRSAEWGTVVGCLGRDTPETDLAYAGVAPTLVERGVQAALICRIRKAGTPSAPERYLLPGRVTALAGGVP